MTTPSPLLHQRFEQRAAERPNATAISYGEGERRRTLTYRELDERANRLARHLRARGVGAESIVALCLERTPELVIAILAVLKAGGGYLPLDPSYPEERLAFMLRDARAAALVTTGDLAAALEGGAPVIRLDADAESIAAQSSQPLELEASSEALAYVIYTSGSTGTPKGVLVTHASVVRLFDCTARWFSFGAEDVWTLFHSYAFDFSVWELWGALLHGGRLVVVPFAVSRSPKDFHELVVGERVTVLNQTPSAFRQFMRVDERQDRSLPLRWVIFGGEALDVATLAPWFGKHGDERPKLVNMYGITETTVHVTYRPLTRSDTQGVASVIGRPLPDLTVALLDPAGAPVTDGDEGEVYVSGPGVARGYLGRPALTAERFVPDPLAASPGARRYRTGDLARRRGDELEYVGRIDHQVKIRGFRIELGEIEAAIVRTGLAREAVVVVRGDGDDKQLVAFLTASEPPASSVLSARLRAALPDYMVPAAFVTVDALPMTSTGKADRSALARTPLPATGGDEREDGAEAALGPVEGSISGFLKERLGLERLTAEEDLFDAGVHSLTLMQLAVHIEEEFLVEVPISALFETTTVREIASVVDGLLAESRGEAAPAARPDGSP